MVLVGVRLCGLSRCGRVKALRHPTLPAALLKTGSEIMTEILYRVKPLAWELVEWGQISKVGSTTYSICGDFNQASGLPFFHLEVWNPHVGTARQVAVSLDEAKSLAQRHWESESGIGQFLERKAAT
jgi:hypothetical protein